MECSILYVCMYYMYIYYVYYVHYIMYIMYTILCILCMYLNYVLNSFFPLLCDYRIRRKKMLTDLLRNLASLHNVCVCVSTHAYMLCMYIMGHYITVARAKLGFGCQPDRPGRLYGGKKDNEKRDHQRHSWGGVMYVCMYVCMYVYTVYLLNAFFDLHRCLSRSNRATMC